MFWQKHVKTNSIYQKRKNPKYYTERKLTCSFGTHQPKVWKAKGRWQHWWLWVHDQVLSDEDLVRLICCEAWCTVVHSDWWRKIPLLSHRFSLVLDGWNMGSLECFLCLFRATLHSAAWLVRNVSQKLLGSSNITWERKPRLTFYVSARPWPHSDICTWAPFSWSRRVLGV